MDRQINPETSFNYFFNAHLWQSLKTFRKSFLWRSGGIPCRKKLFIYSNLRLSSWLLVLWYRLCARRPWGFKHTPSIVNRLWIPARTIAKSLCRHQWRGTTLPSRFWGIAWEVVGRQLRSGGWNEWGKSLPFWEVSTSLGNFQPKITRYRLSQRSTESNFLDTF